MKKWSKMFILFIMIIVALPISAMADQVIVPAVDYSSFQLDNGLQVFVVEDDSIPLVELSIFYKVGSIDEPRGLTGISHFLEHTMFLGTEALAKGKIDELINEVGGVYNAATSYDFTYYYSEVPSSMLELAMAIEADRMINLNLDPVDVEREKDVIRQERRSMIENNVVSAGIEIIQATAFAGSSLEHQVIGTMDDIGNISVEALTEHYQNYYAPNNAVLVVTGDATVDQVKSLVEKYFGDYPSKEVVHPEFIPTTLTEEKTMELPLLTNVPINLMLYPIPEGNHQDAMGISVFLSILVDNQSSRVKQELQNRQQLIIETGAAQQQLRVPGYALIYTVPALVDLVEVTQAAFDDQVALIIAEGVTEEELAVVKKSVLKSLVFSQKDPTSMATSIAMGTLQYGEPDLYRDQIETLNNLTVADIQEIAAKYFTPENRVVGNILPIN